jgi:hypothetical protein
MIRLGLALLCSLALASLGCDRNVEPFDPDEQPSRPDLGRIFPGGAARAARIEPSLPAMPGRGAPPLAAEVVEAAAGAAIEGTIRLGADLGVEPRPGSVLFIIARSGQAGGPPIAVKRVATPSFPLAFRLGPEDRMIQAMPFTGPFQVTARLDSDGDAASRTPGDLQGAIDGPVPAGATGIDLILDGVL